MNHTFTRQVPQTEDVSESEQIARLSVPLQRLVNTYSWPVVKAFLDKGITVPQTIHHLVVACRKEPYRGRGVVLHSTDPSEVMIQASMDAIPYYVPGDAPIPKREKHRLRLKAAIEAQKKAQP